jgi:hypothetical protein
LRDKHPRTIEPFCALAAETLNLERPLRDLVNQAYALTLLSLSANPCGRDKGLNSQARLAVYSLGVMALP